MTTSRVVMAVAAIALMAGTGTAFAQQELRRPSILSVKIQATGTRALCAGANNRRHDDFEQPLRGSVTLAAPTSGGIGIRARCRPLARKSISLARQSISSSVSVATNVLAFLQAQLIPGEPLRARELARLIRNDSTVPLTCTQWPAPSRRGPG